MQQEQQTRRQQWWPQWRYIIPLACLAISAVGVQLSALFCRPGADAQRGGALAIILAFAVIFIDLRRPHQKFKSIAADAVNLRLRLQQAAKVKRTIEQRVSDSEWSISTIVTSLGEYVDELNKESSAQAISLAAGTIIGTIFWAFGDAMLPWWKNVYVFYVPQLQEHFHLTKCG